MNDDILTLYIHIEAALASAYLRGQGIAAPTNDMAESARRKLIPLAEALLANVMKLSTQQTIH